MKKIEIVDGVTTGANFAKDIDDNFTSLSGATTGTSGTSGSSGVNGTSGSSGVDGFNGTSGSSGVDGFNGTSGSSGVDGFNGTSGSSGVDGFNGTSGSSGSSGISPVITLLSITGSTILTTENIYVRASGETYDIFLPASSGSLKTIQIKNLTAGEKSVKVNGNDLIDGLAVKTLALNASIILIDALTGFWDIN